MEIPHFLVECFAAEYHFPKRFIRQQENFMYLCTQSAKIEYRMIQFFKTTSGSIIATDTQQPLSAEASDALSWLFGEATALTENKIEGYFVGPRREMIPP